MSNEHNNQAGARRPLDENALAHTINMMPWRTDELGPKLREFAAQLWLQFCSVPAAAPVPASTQDEPYGYFRAEPFGWTDCAETDEGAIALYERPAAPAVPQGELVPMTDAQRADMVCAVAAICTGTSSRTVAATAIEWAERYYGIAALREKGGA